MFYRFSFALLAPDAPVAETRHYLFWKPCFALFLLAAFFAASPPLQAQNLKVGVIDMNRALNETKEGKKILNDMKAKISKGNEELRKKQDELKKLQDALNKQGFLLSDAARQQKEEEFRRRNRDVERFREDKQTEFARMQQRATERIHQGLMKVINDFAKSEKYDLLVEAGSQPAGVPGAVIYFDNALDVTDEIISRYDKAGSAKAGKK